MSQIAHAPCPLSPSPSVHSDLSSIESLPIKMRTVGLHGSVIADDETSQLSDDSTLFNDITSDTLQDFLGDSDTSQPMDATHLKHKSSSPTSSLPHNRSQGLFTSSSPHDSISTTFTDNLSSLREAYAAETAELKRQQLQQHAACETPQTPSLVSAAFHIRRPCREERQKVLASLGPHLFSASCESSTQRSGSHERQTTTKDDSDGPDAHVTIWNRLERRKIAGNAAPLRRNLQAYLNKHKDCEVYVGQGLKPGQKPRKTIKKRERLKVDDSLVRLQGRFATPLNQLREAGIDLRGLKVAYVNEPGCEQCRVWYSHDEYCGPCHSLTRKSVTVCRSYACRMKRFGVNGSLHPSLKGVYGPDHDSSSRRDFDFHAFPSVNHDMDTSGSDGELLSSCDVEHVSNLPTISLQFDSAEDVF